MHPIISGEGRPVVKTPTLEELLQALRHRHEFASVPFTFSRHEGEEPDEYQMFIYGIMGKGKPWTEWWVMTGWKGSQTDFLYWVDTTTNTGQRWDLPGKEFWTRHNFTDLLISVK